MKQNEATLLYNSQCAIFKELYLNEGKHIKGVHLLSFSISKSLGWLFLYNSLIAWKKLHPVFGISFRKLVSGESYEAILYGIRPLIHLAQSCLHWLSRVSERDISEPYWILERDLSESLPGNDHGCLTHALQVSYSLSPGVSVAKTKLSCFLLLYPAKLDCILRKIKKTYFMLLFLAFLISPSPVNGSTLLTFLFFTTIFFAGGPTDQPGKWT